MPLLRRDIPEICAYHHGRKPKVVFGIPIGGRMQKPFPQTIDSLEATVPLLEEAGFEHGLTCTRNNPYISGARAEITRKALNAQADIVFYIDADMAWPPEALLKVLQTDGHVVAGTYRCRTDDPDEEMYMGSYFSDDDGRPIVRADGAIKAKVVPAGFLKVTTTAIDLFMRAYPELCYGPQYSLSVDLFNHGAYEGLWWGEDYAFSRRYREIGGTDIWIVPNINLDHCGEKRVYEGNYHEYLLRQDGGSKSANPRPPNGACATCFHAHSDHFLDFDDEEQAKHAFCKRGKCECKNFVKAKELVIA